MQESPPPLVLVTSGITMSGALLLCHWPQESDSVIDIGRYSRRFQKGSDGYRESVGQ
ncbi:hypothetical protein DFP74_3284 [Nocardiopsis sp. Huas11]|nr:hypothetical protein DFP74_3284 [Nocardiopsis sp. Huas11]